MKRHLRDFLDHLRLNENASAHTVRAYESDLDQFITFVAAHLGRRRSDAGGRPTSTHLHIRAFLGDLHKRGNSRSSAARKLAAIRTFGRYLRREGAIEGDPAALVGTPKREQRLPAHLAEAEMSRLLEMPDASTPLGRRDRAILELFYASGLRLSELVGLGLEDVNLSGRVVRVLGKGGKERHRAVQPNDRGGAAGVDEGSGGVAVAAGRDPRCRDSQRLPRAKSRRAASNHCSSTTGAGGSRREASIGSCASTSRRAARGSASARTRCATHSPRICSNGRGSARDSGAAGPRAPEHDAALHPRELGAADRRVQESRTPRRRRSNSCSRNG